MNKSPYGGRLSYILLFAPLMFAFWLPDLHGQGLPAVLSPAVPALKHGAAAWADYNGDSLQDLLVCGKDSAGVSRSVLLRNTGTGLIPDLAQNLPQVAYGDVAWGDYDLDGDQDLLITGELAPRQALLQLFENVGGILTLRATPDLPGLTTGRVAWADLDGDGDLDILATGWNPMESYRGLIGRNLGGGLFEQVTHPLLESREWTAIGLGDYDQDGLVDILLGDISPSLAEGVRTLQLHNEGAMQFSAGGSLLPGLYGGNFDFGDMDADGDLDLLCSGMSAAPVTQVSRYQAGQFQTPGPPLEPLGHGEARWADINQDGALDLVICGRNGNGPQMRAYRQVSGTFQLMQGPSGMPALYHARIAWGDWNGDGYPDFLIHGQGPDDLPASNIGTWNPSMETFEF